MNLWSPPELPDEERILTPSELVLSSRAIAAKEVRQAQEDLATAEVRLADAQRVFNEDDFGGGSAIAKAEDNYEAALDALDAAEKKLAWERREEWKKQPPKGAVARTKYLLGQIDWAAIFLFRTPNKRKKK